MKKLSVLGMLILVAMFSFTAKADIITLDGANEIANAFFANSASSQKRALKSAAQLEYAWDSNSLTQKGSSMMKSVDEDPTFYVFNNPDGEGFVIVSGDDNARSVIGYSYEGNIPAADEIPAPMQDYLLGIDEEIKWARTNLTSSNKNLKSANASTAGTPQVEITTAKWKQGSPFNNLCPKVMVEDSKGSFTVDKKYYNSEKGEVETTSVKASEVSTSTGCVPTAFAIVMRYHGWPSQGIGTIKGSYTYDLYSEDGYRSDVRTETIDHSTTIYDWDNMPLEYSSSWTDYQITQVATLMRNLGYAFGATYNPGNTFVNDNNYVPANILNCFNYKVEEVVYGNYNTSEAINDIAVWKGKLKSSLVNNCPIPYAANNSGTGDTRHMFVVDNYTNTDYFHFNFGWGGSANGWFTLEAVATSAGDNYSWTGNGARHRAYINFQPNKTVTVSVAADGEGNVSIEGVSGTSKEVAKDSQVTLTATGNSFFGWVVDGGVVSTENPYTFIATATKTYTAKFLSDGNTVEIYHDYLQDDEDIKANCSVTGLEEKGASYPLGVNLTITANCERGYKFNGWYTVDWKTTENILLSTENPYSFETSEELAAISYSFTKLSPAQFTVTTADANMGTATWSYNGEQGAVYPGDEITLTATPKSGYMFVGWSNGTTTISNEKTCTVTLEEGVTYTANFALAGADYKVSKDTGTFSGGENSTSKQTTWVYNTSENYPVPLELKATNINGSELYALSGNKYYACAYDNQDNGYTTVKYTLSVPEGFIITGYEMTYSVGSSHVEKVTIANDDSSTTPSNTSSTILSAKNLETSSTSFTLSVPSLGQQYITVTNFVVSVLSTGGEGPVTPPTPTQYTVTVSTNGTGGTATVNGGQTATVDAGSTVTILATPAQGYVFDYWTVNGEQNSLLSAKETPTVNSDLTLVANFVADEPSAPEEVTYPTMTVSGYGDSNFNRYLAKVTASTATQNVTVFEVTSESEFTNPTTTALIDKTSTPIIVKKGETELNMTFVSWLNNVSGNASQMDWVQQAVYIDWNNDGDFTDSGELYAKSSDGLGGTLEGGTKDAAGILFEATAGYTRTIAIPAGQAAGTYRMRVVYNEPSARGTNDWHKTLFGTGSGAINKGRAYDFNLKIVENATPSTEPIPVPVYTMGENNSVFYRIPALVELENGTLVAIADQRGSAMNDLPSVISIVAKTSTDKGKTWSSMVTVAQGDASAVTSYGDVAAVYDEVAKKIVAVFVGYQNRTESTKVGLWESASGKLLCLYQSESTDGITWTQPKDITEQVYSGVYQSGKLGTTRYGLFAGSGSAVQLKKGDKPGRLMFVVAARQNSTYAGAMSNFAVYSDDHGATWQVSSNEASSYGDEAKIVELKNGDLLMSIKNRSKGYRLMAKSTNQGANWSSFTPTTNVLDPACNGDVVSYTTADGKYYLLHSMPGSSSNRENVTVYLSADGGDTWPIKRQIYSGYSAYSALEVLNDGTIGIVVEEGKWDSNFTGNDAFNLKYYNFTLDWLLNGQELPENPEEPETPESEATLALIETAKELKALEGVGYPSATAKATLQSAIEAAEANPTAAAGTTLQSAIDTYKTTSDIAKPEAEKVYTFVTVVSEGTMYYIYNNTTTGKLALNRCSANDELPETAKFKCIDAGEGKYYFQSVVDNKYMAYPVLEDKTWLTGESLTGLEAEAGRTSQFEVRNIYSGMNANVTASNDLLFGKVYLWGYRGYDTSKGDSYVAIVVTAGGAWDAAGEAYCNGSFTSAISIKEVASTQYTASVMAGTGGIATVNGTNTVTVASGTNVEFTATPDQGYRFLGWTKGASATYESTDATYNVTVTENISLVANFEAIPVQTYNVNVSVNGNGTVTKSAESVEEGGEVTLEAIAEDGYVFTKWSDESTENPRTITSVTADIDLIAYFEAVPQGNKPLLTFACLSDLHSQNSLIEGDVNSVDIRGVAKTTLQRISKEEKNLDLIVLGGDYTSDCTISEENWQRSRELLIEATRNVFPEGAKTPVIYVNGNHEYEVAHFDALPKNYNAGEYYGTPMKTDIGELPAEDCFYEEASNGTGTSVNLLAAYHYVVNGFDFVVLNTGKNMFANAWTYEYSVESVQWCARKLAKIYEEDANKTVFFLVHIPFSDSNSLSATNKGMNAGDATTLLKSTLAQYPNLVMLYGHDHGTNSAYIREETSQRVTEYATDGSVYTGSGASQENIVYYVQNYDSREYLGYNSENLATTITQTSDVNLTSSTVSGCEGAFLFNMTNYVSDRQYVHCGSSDHNYSGNGNSSGVNQQIYLYKVADPTATTITATLSTTVEDGATYILVARNSATGTAYYALSDEVINSGETTQRMIGVEVTVTNNTITYNRADYNSSLLWTINEKGSSSEKSFFSSFMGSMRYYNNSIDGSVGASNSRIVQALMVYVYSDRVELKMKNYGESGTFDNGNITINKELESYVSGRIVTHSELTVTATPEITSAGGVVNPGSEVTVTVDAPEWHNLYYTTDGTEPTEKSAKVDEGREFTFTPSTTGEVTVKVAAQEGIRLISPSASVTYQVMDTHGITVSATEGGTAEFTLDETEQTVTLTATPATGYNFVNWTMNGNVVATTAEATIAYTEKAQYVANFAKQTFTVTVTASPTNGGTVTEVANPVEYGTTLELAATRAAGYKFVNWTLNGIVVSTNATFTTEAITDSVEYVANFSEVTPEELYEAMCKPTITNIGNVIEVTKVDIENAVRGAVIGAVSLENVPTRSRVIASANYTRYVGATDPITIWPGAEFDLELTLNTGTWYGAQFYQIHNSTENIVASYGYYGAKGESANETLFWTKVSDDNRVVANQTNKTLTFHIALSDEVKAGDIVVFRALLAKNENEVDSVGPCATYSQGSYLDILFKVTKPTERTVTIESNDRDLGYPEIVQPTPSTIGQSSITTSDPVTVRANIQHDAYCRFENWTINGVEVGTDPDSYTYEGVADATITANFVETCMVSVSSSDVNMGTATMSVSTSVVDKNTEVTFIAEAAEGYKFVRWTNKNGELVSNDSEYTVTVESHTQLIAEFAQKTTYNVVVYEGTAKVGETVVTEADKGETVTITATVPEGQEFVNWTDAEGNIVSTDETFNIKVVGEINITANFREVQGGGGEVEGDQTLPSGYPNLTQRMNESCSTSAPTNVHSHSLQGITISVGGEEVLTQGATTQTFNYLQDSKKFSVSRGQDIVITFINGAWNKNVWIGFDWNRDGDFEDVRAVYGTNGRTDGGTQSTGNITVNVPQNASLGCSRIRLLADGVDCPQSWNESEPMKGTHGTGIIGYAGSVHDFTINVKGAATPAPSRTIKAIANFADDLAGTVTVNGSNSGSATAEGTITLVATPASNSQFVNWTLNGEVVGSNATITDNSEGSKLYVANFKKTLTITDAYASSQEESGEGAGNGITNCLFDKNETNFWHSKWQGGEAGYPHWFMVKLDAPQMIDAFNYVSRGTGSNTDGENNGNIVNYQLYISESYIEASSLPTAVKTGTFSYTSGSKYHNVTLDKPVYGQYVMLYATGASANGRVNASCSEFYLYASDDYKTQVDLTKVSGTDATVKVTTDAPATITVGTSTYTTTAENLTVEISTQSNNINIVAFGGNITNVDLGENVAPVSFPETVTEIALRNTGEDEVVVDAPALKKITVVSDVNNDVAKVSTTSDLSQGVQVVVEKEINTPQPVEGKGTPTIYNFLSMPFAFNTSSIKYWDGDSLKAASLEKQIRILMYNSTKRANGSYSNTWEILKSDKDIAANQGFVVIGNNDLGDTVKLQFTSAEKAYNGSVESVVAKPYRHDSGKTSDNDADWNFNGVPYLTSGVISGYTLYFHTGYAYNSVVPAIAAETSISAYQGVMYQAEVTNNISKYIPVETASVARNTNASEDVFARAYISVDDTNPAKIILSDESSENFVVNEDAWYLAPTANTEAAAYFNVGGAEASVSVQPAASELPMTVYTGAGTQHRITLTATDGNYDVYLKDAVTNEVVCLNDEDYNFTAAAKTTIANRFTVSMVEPTGIIDSARAEATIKAVVTANGIKLFGTEEGDQISLYNANGMVITNAAAEDGVTTIATSATGVIIIKVADQTVKVVK